MKRFRTVCLLFSVVFGLSASLRSQDLKTDFSLNNAATTPAPADEPNWATTRRLTYGVQVNYGLENAIPRNISHINMLYAAPQIGAIVWNAPSTSLPVNRFEIISEGILGAGVHPGGALLGDTLLFRFDFKHIHNFVPMFDAGIATVHTTIDTRVPEITGHTQFLSQGGVGVQYFYKPKRAFVIEYRYFHMSNAGIEQPNHGFNGNMLSIGYRWLL